MDVSFWCCGQWICRSKLLTAKDSWSSTLHGRQYVVLSQVSSPKRSHQERARLVMNHLFIKGMSSVPTGVFVAVVVVKVDGKMFLVPAPGGTQHTPRHKLSKTWWRRQQQHKHETTKQNQRPKHFVKNSGKNAVSFQPGVMNCHQKGSVPEKQFSPPLQLPPPTLIQKVNEKNRKGKGSPTTSDLKCFC